MSEIVKFPSWRFHKTERPCPVESQAEAEALGPGWFDNQGEADAFGGAPEPQPPSELDPQPEEPAGEEEAVGEEAETKKRPRKGGR